MAYISDYALAKMNTELRLVDILKQTGNNTVAVFAGNKNKKIFHGIIHGIKFLITDVSCPSSKLNCKLNNNLYTINVNELQTQRIDNDDRFFVVNINRNKEEE